MLWPVSWLSSLPCRLISVPFAVRLLASWPGRRKHATFGPRESSMITAREGLDLLRDGNLRFVADVRSDDALPSRARRIELTAG